MNDWNYTDSLDLEYFLRLDEASPEDTLKKRDRNIYLEREAKTEDNDPFPLLAAWLKSRRKDLDTRALPGPIAQETVNIFRRALVLSGLAAGAGGAFIYLSYSGSTPVNVLPFCAIFVFGQLLLTLLLLGRHLISGFLKRERPSSILITLLAQRLEKVGLTLLHKMRKTTGAETTLNVLASQGRGQAFLRVHSKVVYWPIFNLLQLGGIAFNVGLIAAMFLKISVTDVAFGWQSTLQLGSEGLHRLTGWMAIPWSFIFGEGSGYPTLNEVEGSRIILKDGIEGLASSDLASWWPFLLLCVAVYSLLPRLLLLFYGKWQEKQLASSPFVLTPAAEQILRRMTTPLVSSQAQPIPQQDDTPTATPVKPQEKQEPTSASVSILLPDDCYDQCNIDELRTVLTREGFQADTIYRYQVDYDSDRELLEGFTGSASLPRAGFIFLVESWMPPLMDFLGFLQELRRAVGSTTPFRIRLLGRPDDHTILTPVTVKDHETIWKQKIASLGDPYIEVSPLLKEANNA